MGERDGDGYEVGYGKPPTSTRFKKGQSGNRKGRPKGTNNLKTDLIEELREKITLREGERTKKITKQRAVVKTVLAKALKGDSRAANTLFGMSRDFDLGASEDAVDELLSDDENEILEELVKRMFRDKLDPANGEDDQNGQQKNECE